MLFLIFPRIWKLYLGIFFLMFAHYILDFTLYTIFCEFYTPFGCGLINFIIFNTYLILFIWICIVIKRIMIFFFNFYNKYEEYIKNEIFITIVFCWDILRFEQLTLVLIYNFILSFLLKLLIWLISVFVFFYYE